MPGGEFWGGSPDGGGLFNSFSGDMLGGLFGGISNMFPSNNSTTNKSHTDSTNNVTSNANSMSQSQIESLLRSLSQLTSTSSTNPNLSPEHQALIRSLVDKYKNLTDRPVNMGGYTTQQTQAINRNSGLQKQAVDNIMAARGVSTSPVAATSDANIEAGRIAQINNMQHGIPLMQNQMQAQNLAGAAALAGSIPHGTTSSGFQSQTGNQSSSQSGTQSGQQWGNQYSTGTQDTTSEEKKKSGGGLSGILSGIGAILPFLFV